MKRQIQSQSRFEAGAQGGCEVRLCEFNEQRSPEPQVVRFASAGFDEVLASFPLARSRLRSRERAELWTHFDGFRLT
jgi:hypothetical protein